MKIEKSEMEKILMHDCGAVKKYSAEFSCDECVADEIEKIAPKANEPLDENSEEQNGEAVYSSTCDYTMITPEYHDKAQDSVFNYSGS